MSDNERDELATIISDNEVAAGGRWTTYPHVTAAAVLAAGYHKPRTITTVEEVAECEESTVLRSAIGNVYVKDADLDDESITWWTAGGTEHEYPNDRIALPATVLYEPAL